MVQAVVLNRENVFGLSRKTCASLEKEPQDLMFLPTNSRIVIVCQRHEVGVSEAQVEFDLWTEAKIMSNRSHAPTPAKSPMEVEILQLDVEGVEALKGRILLKILWFGDWWVSLHCWAYAGPVLLGHQASH